MQSLHLLSKRRRPGQESPRSIALDATLREGARRRSRRVHVAYQSSGMERAARAHPYCSFAAAGPPIARGSASNASNSAAFAALRLAHSKSLCMSKFPHPGHDQIRGVFKTYRLKVQERQKISGRQVSDRSAVLSFRILAGRRHQAFAALPLSRRRAVPINLRAAIRAYL
jgi:hypothetical protein